MKSWVMRCESADRETAYFYDAEEARKWLPLNGGGVIKKRNSNGFWVDAEVIVSHLKAKAA